VKSFYPGTSLKLKKYAFYAINSNAVERNTFTAKSQT